MSSSTVDDITRNRRNEQYAIMSRVQRIFFCLLTFVCRLFIAIEAWQACTPDEGGGICPDLNYCCRTSFALDSSSCISSNEQPHNGTGTCCGNHGTTGCGPNYSCSSDGRTCILNRDAKSEQPDMIPSYQPLAQFLDQRQFQWID